MRSMSRILPAAASPLPFLDSPTATELRAIHSNAPTVSMDARILGLFPTGFYLEVDAHPWGVQVLPVMGTGALQLPMGLQVPQLTSDHLGELQPEMAATVALSTRTTNPTVERVEVGGLSCVCVRTWRPSRIEPLAPLGLQWCSLGVIESVRDRLTPGRVDLGTRSLRLVRALESESASAVDSCIDELLGYGPGSSPSGDDALCGIGLALRWTSSAHARSRKGDLLAQRLPSSELETRTTAISAVLLRAALKGYCVPEVEIAMIELARLIADPEPADRRLDDLVAGMDRIGHHSGHDLLIGVLAVLTVLAHASELIPVSPLEGTAHADDS